MRRIVASKYRVYVEDKMVKECDSLRHALKVCRNFTGYTVTIYAVLENGMEVILR